MSARRVYVDGVPTWLKENDGAVGRLSFSRIGIRGGGPPVVSGSFVVGESERARAERTRRIYNARRDAAKPQKRDDLAGVPRPTCGKTLRIIGEPCARKPGHGWDCKSAEDLAKRAADRRAERPSGVGQPTTLERLEHRRARQNEWQRERRALGLRR